MKKPDFKDISFGSKFSIKIRDIHKITEINCIRISLFVYENIEKFPFYDSKVTFKGHVYLLLMEKQAQFHYVLSKSLNTSMCIQILHCNRKYFCRYCLQQCFYCKNVRKTIIISKAM